MNETLTVRDFGPIKDATVTFKRVTVFIGPTGGGKSTLAKLAAVWKEDGVFANGLTRAQKGLVYYGLLDFFEGKTETDWKTAKGFKLKWPERVGGSLADIFRKKPSGYTTTDEAQLDQVVEAILGGITQAANTPNNIDKAATRAFIKRTIESDFVMRKNRAELFDTEVVYVPAERVFYSAVSSSLAGLMRDDLDLPKPLLDFVNSLWQARKEITDLDLPLFNAKYEYRNEQDFIRLPGREKELRLSVTASGIQSVAPLLVLLEHLSRQTERPQSFIIEEPELNLFPEAQQQLLNVLVAKCAKADGQNDLIITTHSPYLLASCNLLLEAWKVWEKRPELEAEIAAIVPRESWINPAEFAAYHVADGGVKPITDERTHLLGGNELDAVSGDIADAFRKLLRLAKQQPAE